LQWDLPRFLEFFVHLRYFYWRACPYGMYRACLATLLGTLVVAHASAGAQTVAPASPDTTAIAAVVSPTAYAPPVLYRSVFVDTPTGIETEETDWKKANADVGQFKRGHMDILRWEEAQAAKVPNATKSIAPRAGSTGATP
jgi:hypothetical protein